MATISPSSLASYYLMSGQSSSAGTDSLQSSGMESLAQILSNNTSDTVGSSYLDQISLSPEAQNFLNGLSGTNTNNTNIVSDPLLAALEGSSTDNNTTSANSSNFILTSSQQQQITNILEQYKNAPFTQATFDQIQNALQAAGLGTDRLSAQDQINSFNPTTTLLNDLNGNTANNSLNALDPANIAASEQTKSSNYINQIYQQWQSISTTANNSSTTTNGAAVAPIASTTNA